jgi:malonyl-CoA decarboxylase
LNVSFLQELLNTVAEQSRQLIPWALSSDDDIVALSRALMSGRGEASGVAIAREIVQVYQGLSPQQRRAFFEFLADGMAPNPTTVRAAAEGFLATPTPTALNRLQQAVESPRQEFFRRLNLAPGATERIVAMREELLRALKDKPGLAAVDDDLRHLLGSWFNRGFLVLRRIDWQTPAAILDKIIAYEAVHEIKGWDDLRRRLEPADRRCFAFFHPALVDDPLIFVEVALCEEVPASINEVLDAAPPVTMPKAPTTAVFYSISNCQEGLKGISFGNFLIKQVVEELVRERPSLTSFVTLSPIPGFARWLNRGISEADPAVLSQDERVALSGIAAPDWLDQPAAESRIKPVLLAAAARYFLQAKAVDNRPIDAVARFHLGNGARLDRINWRADVSQKGLRESLGLMVNYRYELKEIERNHEAYANEGRVIASRNVQALQRAAASGWRRGGAQQLEPPPASTRVDLEPSS